MAGTHRAAGKPVFLYTKEQRARRDNSVWTTIQGVLAPLQFLAFIVSLVLVLRYLLTGAGYDAATISILFKTVFLLTIMVTGAIWEKVVFGQYLFAPAFFWEDVFSFLVIALHLAYVWALWTSALSRRKRCYSLWLRMQLTSSMPASFFGSCASPVFRQAHPP